MPFRLEPGADSPVWCMTMSSSSSAFQHLTPLLLSLSLASQLCAKFSPSLVLGPLYVSFSSPVAYLFFALHRAQHGCTCLCRIPTGRKARLLTSTPSSMIHPHLPVLSRIQRAPLLHMCYVSTSQPPKGTRGAGVEYISCGRHADEQVGRSG